MNRPRTYVLAALAVLLALAGSTGLRIYRLRPVPARHAEKPLARTTLTPPPGAPVSPRSGGSLQVPCWSCPEARTWPITFRTDLDLLAPLGTGSANAGLWLKDFDREVGARAAEGEAAMKRRVDGPRPSWKVLAPDDPLLSEAGPWADQAVMRFSPEIFEVRGAETRIPNLLLSLTLVRSWAARALASPDVPAALADCRRAIRWGRLLRQEDVTIIQDLIGLACIEAGAEALYQVASRSGDRELALTTAIVLGEVAPQRLLSAHHRTRTDLGGERSFSLLRVDHLLGLDVDRRKVDRIVEAARGGADRRFRLEAAWQLGVVRAVGSWSERRTAEAALESLSSSPDPVVATNARWTRSERTSLPSVAPAAP